MPVQRWLCCAALLAGSAHAAQDCEIQGVAVNPIMSSTLQGKTGLMRCTDRDSGRLEREQEVSHGRMVGQVRLYQDDQLVKEYGQNDRGNLHGRLREFSTGGRVQRDALYDNGVVVGIARTYHPNGQLQRGSVMNAAGNEIAAVEFTTQGLISDLVCGEKPLLTPLLDDSKACGFVGGPSTVEFFFEGGALRQRARFQAGRRIQLDTLRGDGKLLQQEESTATSRVERTFSPTGTKRREMLWSLSGSTAQREKEQEFNPAGKLFRERRWKAGELASETLYYPNGQLRRKAEYASGPARVLQVSEYYDSGVLSAESTFANTTRYALTPVGTHRKFDAAGKLRSETVYDERGKIVRDRTFDEGGQALRDDPGPEDARRSILLK
jgi:antitoxin component YwqK of YwqJK toxin-antitoxin module